MTEQNALEDLKATPALVARERTRRDGVRRLKAVYEQIADMTEETVRRRLLQVLTEAEFALPHDDLQKYALAKFQSWLAMEWPKAVRVALDTEAVMEKVPAEIALRNAAAVQTAMAALPVTDQEKLRRMSPVSFDDQAVPLVSVGAAARAAHEDAAGIGTPVFAADGRRLGSVKLVYSKYIQVDGPHLSNYWLSSELIRTASPGGVLLDVTAETVDDYKLSELAGEDAESPVMDAEMDTRSSLRHDEARLQTLVRVGDERVEAILKPGPLDRPALANHEQEREKLYGSAQKPV